MRFVRKSRKGILSLLLVAVLMLSVIACVSVVSAQETDRLADEAAGNYYLWGLNTNDPDFGSMSSPTGSFAYDGSLGYYYYDLTGSSGDYCFVVSEVNNSGAAAVKSPAVGGAAESGMYYLQQGNYHGYACLHLWNPSGESIRLYFRSTSGGLYAVALSSIGTQPTSAPPTQRPTTVAPTVRPTTVTPTVKPTTLAPTSLPTVPGGAKVVYCENEANWSVVSVYMWSGDGAVQNAGWPGAAATNIGGKIWRYTLTRDYENIIFSESGNNQTTDLKFPGSGYIYNNKTGQWSVYDTSPLQVQTFTTDLSAPQYAGVGVMLTAAATGEGTVWYKFSVTNPSGSTTTVADYSTKSSALWTPSSAGNYTLVYEFKDAAGNTNKRTLGYKIEDGSSSQAPFIKQVTPASGDQIKKSAACNITVSAGGGNTGTKLLFYKYTVTDASGKIVNVPYYSRSTSYSFTPTALGQYTVTVSVQASDNSVVTRDYVYNSVNTIVNPTEPPVVTPTESSGSASLIGDADDDGSVTILDATRIQRWLADLITDDEINLSNADSDHDKSVTILDATRIQRWLADLIDKL